MCKEKLFAGLIGVLFLLLSGCVNRQQTADQAEATTDLPAIRQRGELVALTLYNSTSYFNYRGEPMGFQYELCRQFADSLGVTLKVKVANSPEELIRKLQQGEGDLIAYNLNVTNERKDSILFCGEENLSHQVLVQRAGRNALKDVTEMPGKTIHVKPGRYQQRLENLNNELGGGILIHPVTEDSISEEDLIEQVALGQIDYTICDNEVAKVNRTYYSNLDIRLNVSFVQRSSWAVRKDEPLLAQAANEWFKRNKTSNAYRSSAKRYFEQSKRIAHGSILSVKKGQISRFDSLFRHYARRIDWDWRLLASLAYAESNFDPTVVSWAGARGLMQLMPRTARILGVPPGKEDDPEESIKAAVVYIGRLDKSFASVGDKEERIKFILASYNAGEGHIKDAMALAKKYGADPTCWKDNVEKYLKLKSHERYFNDEVCKNGYFRGEETCRFVKDILQRHRLYKDKIKH